MRLILNIIWLIFGGLWLAILYTLAALLAFVLIITIPFGFAALRMARFCLWPFGRTVIRKETAGLWSGIGNIIWLLLFGWELALAHLITGIAQCVTIIGIPLGLANFKMIPVSLLPIGREIVSVDEARRMGLESGISVP
ncbi:MAG TPA: YccF domain-containing protein [Solirubrobacteraceae bacterium]